MTNNKKFAAAVYEAPVCETFEAVVEGVLCESFFSSDQINPGQGEDWGVFRSSRDDSRGFFE